MTTEHPSAPSESKTGTVGTRYHWLVWPSTAFDNMDTAIEMYRALTGREPDRANCSDGQWWLGWVSKAEGRRFHRQKHIIQQAYEDGVADAQSGRCDIDVYGDGPLQTAYYLGFTLYQGTAPQQELFKETT